MEDWVQMAAVVMLGVWLRFGVPMAVLLGIGWLVHRSRAR
jgi:hypothetical protein